jgi:hypothetical protein
VRGQPISKFQNYHAEHEQFIFFSIHDTPTAKGDEMAISHHFLTGSSNFLNNSALE